MEPTREHIEDLMRRYGMEEDEARASYHLRQTAELFEKLYPDSESNIARLVTGPLKEVNFRTHFRALNRILGMRVLDRDYPDGWGRISKPEQEDPDPNPPQVSPQE